MVRKHSNLVLAFMVIGALTVFWLANSIARTIATEEFIDDIRAKGGDVWNVNIIRGGEIVPVRPSWVPRLLDMFVPPKVNYVYLPGERIGDEDLVSVFNRRDIIGLNLSNTRITDKTLTRLAGLRRIRELQLYGVSTITDEAIGEFVRLNPDCKLLR